MLIVSGKFFLWLRLDTFFKLFDILFFIILLSLLLFHYTPFLSSDLSLPCPTSNVNTPLQHAAQKTFTLFLPRASPNARLSNLSNLFEILTYKPKSRFSCRTSPLLKPRCRPASFRPLAAIASRTPLYIPYATLFKPRFNFSKHTLPFQADPHPPIQTVWLPGSRGVYIDRQAFSPL